jgi:hypothetical protein
MPNTNLNLSFYLSRLKNIFYSDNKNVSYVKKLKFPKIIGKYIFNYQIREVKPYSFYLTGVYKNKKGESAVAKIWQGNIKNSAYYWLMNEIDIYKSLTILKSRRVKPGRFKKTFIPDLITAGRAGDKVYLLLEKIPGQQLTIEDSGKYSRQIKTMVEYIRWLGLDIDKTNFIHINLLSIIISTPILVIRAIIIKPGLTRHLLQALVKLIQLMPNALHRKWDTLVHRDIPGNIHVYRSKLYLLDWQTAAISNPYIELASMALAFWKNNRYRVNFKDFISDKYLLTDKRERKFYQFLCLFLILNEISLVGIMTRDEELSFLNKHIYARNLFG